MEIQKSHYQTCPYFMLLNSQRKSASLLLTPFQEWQWIQTGDFSFIDPYYLGGCV